MWAFISNLFGSKKVVETVADIAEKGANGIDKLFFTSEEKSIASQKYFDSWLELQKTLATENTPSGISRRILAWIITFSYIIMIAAGIILYKIIPDVSTFIFNNGVNRLEFGFNAIITTYFVTGGIAKIVSGNKDK